MLLDSCSLIWLASHQKELSGPAIAAIKLECSNLFVSAISAFEIGLKHRKHKLTLPAPVEEWFPEILSVHGIREIPVDGRIAARSAVLPPHHADPCDRIIIATAQLHPMPILTPDPAFRKYRVKTLW